MGGFGSGRKYHPYARQTIDDSCAIDIHFLKRKGTLIPGNNGSISWSSRHSSAAISFRVTDRDAITLIYASGGQDFHYDVPILYSECNYGGQRPWLQCIRCSGRVGKLILKHGLFMCRQCGNMAYQSQNDGSTARRFSSKAGRLRSRLGSNTRMVDPIPGKPKGMHWRTYYRLREKIETYELIMLGDMSSSLTALTKQLTRHL